MLTLDGAGTLTDQLYRAVRGEILAARLRPGARLPASRQLAADLSVSRNVAVLAYERLLAEGYVAARRGAGHFVAAELPDPAPLAPRRAAPPPTGRAAPAQPARLSRFARQALRAVAHSGFDWLGAPPSGLIAFRHGVPSFGDFPYATWCRVLARRARRATLAELTYGPPQGVPALREAVADYLRRARGVVCDAEQVLIVNGSQQGLDLAARVALDPGDRAVVEEPCYRPARIAFAAAGARVTAVPVDDDGLCIDALPSDGETRLLYVTPSHQFPTGVVLPLARRLRLLEWARRAGAVVFEDDYDSEYRYGGRPLAALQGLDRSGCVLYAGSFSKVMFPGLRLGYLVAPPALVPALRMVKALADAGCAPLPQLALADFIRDGHFERHLRRTRTRNAVRRAALVEALDRGLGAGVSIAGAAAGLHVLAWLRDVPFGRSGSLCRAAAAAGARVSSVGPFYATPPRRAGLLLGYAALAEREIRDGIRRLTPVVKALSGGAVSRRG